MSAWHPLPPYKEGGESVIAPVREWRDWSRDCLTCMFAKNVIGFETRDYFCHQGSA